MNPVFAEPWHAQAMAIAARLQEAGLVTPAEWSETLGAAIRAAQAAGDADDGTTYHQHVVTAIETVLTAKGLVREAELRAMKAAWTEAYLTTPHGQPVEIMRP